MKLYYVSILFAFFTLNACNLDAQSQQSEPSCTHHVKSSGYSEIINYLSKKYGLEQTELILLRKTNYETQNDVIVLFGKSYLLAVSQLDELIASSNDEEILNNLKVKKSKLVNFISIENQLLN